MITRVTLLMVTAAVGGAPPSRRAAQPLKGLPYHWERLHLLKGSVGPLLRVHCTLAHSPHDAWSLATHHPRRLWWHLGLSWRTCAVQCALWRLLYTPPRGPSWQPWYLWKVLLYTSLPPCRRWRRSSWGLCRLQRSPRWRPLRVCQLEDGLQTNNGLDALPQRSLPLHLLPAWWLVGSLQHIAQRTPQVP